jgi:hypothetical protein
MASLQDTLPSGKRLHSYVSNGPVEIVGLPMKNAWWIVPSFFGTVYHRVQHPTVLNMLRYDSPVRFT